jgi:molecular chaperone GrpE
VTDRTSDYDRAEEEQAEHRGPTVRDKRRIDPDTFQLRESQAPAAGGPAPQAEPDGSVAPGELEGLKASLAERTSDLQRLQAEYVNYKRRVDRDREVVRRHGIESVLRDLLSVLDDIRSAREHEGELSGGFKAVAEAVERVASKYGLEAYGAKGDPFDPHIHEALMHAHAEGITGPTCVEILQPGYRVQDKVLRPARVAVAEPDPNATAATEAADTAAEATATDAHPTDVSQ